MSLGKFKQALDSINTGPDGANYSAQGKKTLDSHKNKLNKLINTYADTTAIEHLDAKTKQAINEMAMHYADINEIWDTIIPGDTLIKASHIKASKSQSLPENNIYFQELIKDDSKLVKPNDLCSQDLGGHFGKVIEKIKAKVEDSALLQSLYHSGKSVPSPEILEHVTELNHSLMTNSAPSMVGVEEQSIMQGNDLSKTLTAEQALAQQNSGK